MTCYSFMPLPTAPETGSQWLKESYFSLNNNLSQQLFYYKSIRLDLKSHGLVLINLSLIHYMTCSL